MKDPGGHGSNGRGSNSALTKTQGPAPAMPRGPTGKVSKVMSGGGVSNAAAGVVHGGVPVTSNAQAAQALMSRLKSTQAPVHPAMAGKPSSDGGSAS